MGSISRVLVSRRRDLGSHCIIFGFVNMDEEGKSWAMKRTRVILDNI